MPSAFIPLAWRCPPTARRRLQLDYEIEHDGYRLMARRDPVGIRLITRRATTVERRVIMMTTQALARAACLVSLRSARGLHFN